MKICSLVHAMPRKYNTRYKRTNIHSWNFTSISMAQYDEWAIVMMLLSMWISFWPCMSEHINISLRFLHKVVNRRAHILMMITSVSPLIISNRNFVCVSIEFVWWWNVRGCARRAFTRKFKWYQLRCVFNLNNHFMHHIWV